MNRGAEFYHHIRRLRKLMFPKITKVAPFAGRATTKDFPELEDYLRVICEHRVPYQSQGMLTLFLISCNRFKVSRERLQACIAFVWESCIQEDNEPQCVEAIKTVLRIERYLEE